MAGVRINAVKTWSADYYYGYSENPFDDLVRDTFQDTRSKSHNFLYDIKPTHLFKKKLVYLILGQFHEHIGLMWSLHNRGLLNNGD